MRGKMKISFDFDPETKKVTNVTVEESQPKKTPSRKLETDVETIVLNGNSLKLNQAVLDSLKVGPGDRVFINFDKSGHPILVTQEASNLVRGGLLITKSLTISCKGATHKMLSQLSPTFGWTPAGEGTVTLTNEALTAAVESSNEMNLNLLDQTDFKSPLEDGEEIEFSFELK